MRPIAVAAISMLATTSGGGGVTKEVQVDGKSTTIWVLDIFELKRLFGCVASTAAASGIRHRLVECISIFFLHSSSLSVLRHTTRTTDIHAIGCVVHTGIVFACAVHVVVTASTDTTERSAERVFRRHHRLNLFVFHAIQFIFFAVKI